MIDREALRNAVQKECARLGVEDWEIVFSSGTSISAEMVDEELVDFSSATDTSISARVIVDGREGVATSQRVDESVIPALVSMALENSRVKEIDPSYTPEIHKGDESYPQKTCLGGHLATASQIKDVLTRTQKAIFASDGRVSKGTGSSAATGSGETYVENSKGLSLHDSWSSSYISSSVIVKEGDDVKNAYLTVEGDITKADMSPAVDKALRRLAAGTVASGSRPVIFSPECFNMFLSTFSSAFSGKSALLGLSPYRDKVDTQIAASCVTLIDDPLYPDYPAQCTFDGDAYATFTKPVIESGVLRTLLYNRQWALKAGCRSTGNAVSTPAGSAIRPYSFYIAPGSICFDNLASQAGDGIYVTAMKGFHAGADAVSGDFSIESSGFLIRGGKVEGPVQGFTVAGNFFQMLKDIQAVGDDLEFDVTLSSFRTGSPSVLVSGLSIAGKQ